MLIDTHAHLFWDSYKNDFDSVVQRSFVAGITTIINVGVDSILSQRASKLQSAQIQMYSTIGIHPHEAFRLTTNTKLFINQEIQKLENIYFQNPQKVIAIGECGIDFFFSSDPNWDPQKKAVKNTGPGFPYISPEQLSHLQVELFQSQINLAKKLDLPLIVHCRDDRSQNLENIEAWKICLNMVRGLKGILHCYSGTSIITQQVLQPGFNNFLVSFAGNITYPNNGYLREAAKTIPLEKICLETDCPFLSPQSIRGQRNEPSSVREIAQLIAELKGVSLEEIANKTTENVKKLFNIKT